MSGIIIGINNARERVLNLLQKSAPDQPKGPFMPADHRDSDWWGPSEEEKRYRELSEKNPIPPFYKHPPRFDEHGNPTPYAGIPQKSSHNSFQRADTMLEQYQNSNITSFELDVHNADQYDWWNPLDISKEYAPDGDPFVYHNNNDPSTHYPHLSDGLADIRAIHEYDHDHDVITLHVDLKDSFIYGKDLSPNDLDRLLRQQLGDLSYTPGDLIHENNASSLSEAYNNGKGMPSLNDLEGRVMIVLTGDIGVLNAYQNGADNPVAFISPDPEFDKNGNFDPNSDAIFYNTNNSEHAAAAADEGYMSRIYDVDSTEEYQQAVDAGATHIATDFISSGDIERLPDWAIND